MTSHSYLTFALLFLMGPAAVATTLSAALSPEASSLIKEGDAHYARRSDLKEAQIALDAYKKAVQADPADPQPHWKSSQTLYWLADHTPAKKEKLALFEEAIAAAQQGIKADPDSVESHFWLAANWGTYGESRGVLKSLFLIKPIRHELNEVNRINPRYQGGAGYRILGIVDYKVPPFSGGSKKRSLEQLEKARAIDPANPYTHYHLAEYYSVMGKEELARQHLDELSKAKPSAEYDEIDIADIQKKGEALKKKL